VAFGFCDRILLLNSSDNQHLQRFKFCGDLDSPDWVLAGISALSGIVSYSSPASGFLGQLEGF
jgi:hypothetical protein